MAGAWAQGPNWRASPPDPLVGPRGKGPITRARGGPGGAQGALGPIGPYCNNYGNGVMLIFELIAKTGLGRFQEVTAGPGRAFGRKEKPKPERRTLTVDSLKYV